MATSPQLRQISRDKLALIFKTPELVKLFEDLLYTVDNTLPGAADAVQTNLDAHIADAGDAHPASAIGNIPAGNIAATNVQAAINELDSDKLAANLVTGFILTLLDDPDPTAARLTLGLGSIALQDYDAVSIQGGAVNGTPVGNFTPSTGKFTTLETTSSFKTTSTVVGSLPSAATAGAGARSFVTDATSTAFSALAIGGGTNKVPVYSDGTSWLVG